MIEDAIHAAQSLNISPKLEAIKSFVENVDIVCDGLRTAYYADEFPQHLSIKNTRKLLCAVHTSLRIQRKVIVAVLSDGDIVIINPFRFVEKYNLLVSGEWTDYVIPLNIGSIAPFDLNGSPSLIEEIQSSLIDSCSALYDMCIYNTPDPSVLEFAAQESDIRVITLHIDPIVVGKEFFLGWILDYTCVYHTKPPSDDTISTQSTSDRSIVSTLTKKRPPHCLLMENLLRVTVTGVCPMNRFDDSNEIYGPADLYMVTLKQFTIPSCFLNRESILVYKQMVENSVDKLRRDYQPSSWVVSDIVVTYDEVLLESFKL